MQALREFTFYVFMWFMNIFRVVLWIVRGLSMCGTVIFALLWIFTHRPNMVPFIVFFFLMTFLAFIINYGSIALEARLRRSMSLYY
jgi:hypothetical protein